MMTDPCPLTPGAAVWVTFGRGSGREQAGRRPAIVVSSTQHLTVADQLVTVLPCTSTNRGWPNHVPVTGPAGLTQQTFAMTEQVRTIDRARVAGVAGDVSPQCYSEILGWFRRWLA